jgi:hypothetical protein
MDLLLLIALLLVLGLCGSGFVITVTDAHQTFMIILVICLILLILMLRRSGFFLGA